MSESSHNRSASPPHLAGSKPPSQANLLQRQERPLRVLLLTNIPSPYQIDFFSELHTRPAISLHVLFAASSERDRQFQLPEEFPFEATLLEGSCHKNAPKDWHTVENLAPQIEQHLPCDIAILSGSYFMPVTRRAKQILCRHRIPWCYWGENPAKKTSSGLRAWAKRTYLRRWLASSAGVLGIGTRGCAVYRSLLPESIPVRNLPYAPNLDRYYTPTGKVIAGANCLRSDWGCQDPTIVLFSGSLSVRKAPDLLIHAFAHAARKNDKLRLLLIGDGPLRAELARQAELLNIAGKVQMPGFLTGDQLASAYTAANLFVLPTRGHEGWGVVVQEAMAAGLPVLVSSQVGAGADLITDDTEGAIFPAGDVDALARQISRLTRSNQQLARLGQQARSRVVSTDARGAADNLLTYLKEIYSAQNPVREQTNQPHPQATRIPA